MASSNNISPGMIIKWNKKIYRVDSSVKVAMPKGKDIIRTKLRDLITEEVLEKNFKLDQPIEEVSLKEHILEYLYPEGKDYLFLNIENLEQVMVSSKILKNAVNYLKEGIQIKAKFYGDTIFEVELPQFLELMVVQTDTIEEGIKVANATKSATLETGAKIHVPLFIEPGDIIKVDVYEHEYIQRV